MSSQPKTPPPSRAQPQGALVPMKASPRPLTVERAPRTPNSYSLVAATTAQTSLKDPDSTRYDTPLPGDQVLLAGLQPPPRTDYLYGPSLPSPTTLHGLGRTLVSPREDGRLTPLSFDMPQGHRPLSAMYPVGYRDTPPQRPITPSPSPSSTKWRVDPSI